MKQLSRFILWGFCAWLFSAHSSIYAANTCTGKIVSDSSYTVNIHKSLPPFVIRHIEKERTEGGGIYGWCYELHIQVTEQDSLLKFTGESMNVWGSKNIQFVDVNFDNYLDIKILNAESFNGVNAGFAIYLYDRVNGAFAYHSRFSDIFGGSYAKFDADKKEIFVSGDLGCMGECWSARTYRVENDSLFIIRSTIRDRVIERDSVYYTVTTRELIEGKFTVVNQKREGSQYEEN